MAGFGVLWRVLNMSTYRAYYYCGKCERPLREKEQRSETHYRNGQVGVTHYCMLCNSRVRKPVSMAGWMGIALLTCVMAAAAAGFIYIAPVDDVEVDSEKWIPYLVIFPLMALPLAFFFGGWRKKSKCKPTYDRWVMQHGADPVKWPDAPKPE